MATANNSTRLPLMAHNFRVVVAAKTAGFMEVSGLSRSHETLTYRHGLSAFEGEQLVKYRQDKYEKITLKKGVVPLEAMFLHIWLESRIELPMTVSLCDAQGLPVVNWRIARAVPVTLTAPTLSASGSDVAIDTFEVMAAGVTVDIVPVVLAF